MCHALNRSYTLGGLVVDYLGIANSLKKALAVYAESGGAAKRLSIRAKPWR